MSQRLSRLLGAVLVATLVALFPSVPASAATTKIMIVGDSISQGAEGDYTWRYRFAQHLASSGVAADFVGPWTGTRVLDADHANPMVSHSGAYRPGISFDSANLAQWGWRMDQAKDVIGANVSGHTPDYLLVELGFNDLGWGVSDAPGLISHFETFVANARAAKPNIRIVIGNVPHRTPLDVNPGLPALISQYNALLAARVPQLSTSASPIVLADIDGPFNENTDTYDGLHPNVRGEYVIAKAFADRVSGSFGLGGAYGAIPTSLPAGLTPAAPTSITAVRVADKLKVSWSHSFGATGYQFWKRDVTTGGAWEKGLYEIGADSWTDDWLPAGHRMEYQVRATRGSSWTSPASPTASAVVRPMPDVPNVTVVANPDRPYTLTVRWSAVADAHDYHVYAAPGCDSTVPAPSAFTEQQWGLAGKTSWTQELVFEQCRNYKVVASRWGGHGSLATATTVRAYPYRT
ncbi:SGNH/GDSL hydrolase family protein [Actinoplanes sp. NEAU-A12]|uniref:SGNH/GDSL hydrolase family protein n=1 Tax=Actinoplanes sandaracinus TaxID=3045177 RepID=A0ABT6WKP1_9ACTN|nr:SGNH/GDSL hydrolase family protein [Actinoplanes sandaracinus]MDI6100300.1 SGNH/GDSL hydrolase family protein [Actinoplanes sandaracinus]